MWRLREPANILARQLPAGSWPAPAGKRHPAINHQLIETWKQIRYLVDEYGFTREHPQIQKAAEYLFSCQTTEGDIRGFLANQYASYYTGALLALLIHAGYEDDPRVEAGMQWLLRMRQDDGGWTIPLLTRHLDRRTQYRLTSEFAAPLEPDRAQPFSHNWTGMVLRAFAAHSKHRKTQAAIRAAELLKSRFFLPDNYTSYQAADYWLRFDYPFWWNNLISALDSVSRIGSPKLDGQTGAALEWFIRHQEQDGLWKVSYAKAQKGKVAKAAQKREWIALAICRVFERLFREDG